jgi:ABC-type multidrug transport system ATPase subunit
MNVLSIRNLTKTYPGGARALRGVSLEIPPGMFGLLGPNGAGKSTLMKILATLLDPDSGSATLDGLDLVAEKDTTRRLLGYLPQEFGVYPKLSALDMLNHLAVMKGITHGSERKEIVEGLLQQTNLWDVRKKALGGFSGGMKQRFGIAQALLANPRLIIVDEPTAGLDPAERNRFLNLLSSIGRNVVVILSTHIVEDVRELCSKMAIISMGEVLLEGVPAQSIDALKGKVWKKIVAADTERESIEKSFPVISTHLVGGLHEVRVYSETAPGDGFASAEADLEDVYFHHLTRHRPN